MLLNVAGVEVSYSGKTVVKGVSLRVEPGEIVGLIGHNGAGKTTLLKAIVGVLPLDRGEVVFQGETVSGRKPFVNIREGMVYVPQGGIVFTELTVAENLEMGGCTLSDPPRLEENLSRIYSLFPVLKERRNGKAGVLSGGERQMLAIGMGLAAGPKLLMLDEPSGGLAPLLVQRLFEVIRSIRDRYRTSILLVEQNVVRVLDCADRIYGMQNGLMVFEGGAEQLQSEGALRKTLLGV
ncbi:MAG: ABC transporter ATP-binding protein [Candidatus Tectomicrobia bacterium]|uniref:ABC transporter ATP-binding protein n=1 Tax=Tectimicrobiota bacterium TaxID=2528274 RepID=A0A932GPU6_UNCTE|nr:ABC transporter ATP-binding protein [Candidatus Tectomicrobia bacterium]